MKLTPHPDFGWRGEEAGRLRWFFYIRKSYFLQVKSLVLVGTLEKYQFLDPYDPKSLLNLWVTLSILWIAMTENNRVVEKLILHLFPFHENGRLKQFC
ncbi:hypothetical protein LBK6_14600 [Leptospira borgpetersenii serovar Hardjo]|nr:hypothetical protein LBK6_14600 [Leptospira borgpetersenii serovar Hardjo]AMX62731.1 hypothetical protein LBK9_14520 [Leptospira borgpetersenii serovar Hardjo]AMX65974.1 hypothetical protein LBK30_14530 [Leptospira borgpetersenii serovar Hardjo]AMX69207.1 hypothetical protein LBHA_14485 [Leptospira borgpetersenii serovar Hardjo]AMX70131.1 hypothetical protein LBHB_01960 [Leptospira borgpetersenii serovar Hardjo]